MPFIKNQRVNGFTFGMTKTNNGQKLTDADVPMPLGYVTIDDGDQNPLLNVVRYKGNGEFAVDIEAVEMNGDQIGLTFDHPDAITIHFTIPTLSEDDAEFLGAPTPPGPGGYIDILELASSPKRTRTAEGTIEERSVDELIKADQYLAAQQAGGAVPWGIRLARGKPGSSIGGSAPGDT